MSSTEPVTGDLASMLASCTVRRLWAEQDEGPYHRSPQTRRNVVDDREGVALQLGIRLGRDTEEQPLHGLVEIWHCDALGRYSGFPTPGPPVDGANASPREAHLTEQGFLRGRQATDAAGMVEFHTIYPGWYPGRTVHIHLRVDAGDAVLTSQLYFPEQISHRVLALPPYAERSGRDTTNPTDEIFPTGGQPAVLDVGARGDGYRAGICLIVPTTDATS